ncbi:DUF4097 family beta strand repeat-containing protein [Paenibacillus sp. HW567]|uniref:DUF4097 family beta strand repeat-containing protein n=1 Tax=Paenibacillus sp. HW567 TaxID=1034769 RepID=UPI0003663D40|nr:DUF4097 family beta strand repeat-containing protein [Paenibacillus sp. HW567]
MKKWMITAAILLVVGLIGVVATMWNEGGFSFRSVEINQNQAIDAEGVKDVVFSLNGMNITTVKGSTNEIKAALTGKVSKKFVELTKLNIVRENDTVKISVDTKGSTVGISIFDVQIRVELPEQQYDSVVLNTGSGDLNMAELAANTIRIEADSGKVTLDRLTAQKLKLKTGSGNINMKDVEAELELEADTAEIEADMADITHPMKITTGSGEVTLYTTERPSSATIKFSHGSGELRNQWDGTKQPAADEEQSIVFGDGSVPVDIKTGSGNLTLGKR